jgi:hypothetical protein
MMATRARRETPRLAELDVVRLLSVVYTDDATYPVGSIGTIVFEHDGADAFEVEFAQPSPAVITLRAADLASAV